MKVKIFKPTKSTMQSGHGKTHQWVIEPDTTSGKKAESLMGWISSEDTLTQIKLSFSTKEEAVEFASSKGWQYTVANEHNRRVKPRSYMDNFRYINPQETGKK